MELLNSLLPDFFCAARRIPITKIPSELSSDDVAAVFATSTTISQHDHRRRGQTVFLKQTAFFLK